MNYLQRLEHWGDMHHPKWIDFVRIALGIFLFFKGYEFLTNMSSVMDLMNRQVSFGSFTLILLGHYIVFAHLVGGFLLAIGLLTRFACLIQIPILLGAIFFLSTSGDILKPYSEIVLTVLVLLLLIYFLIAGNGPLSIKLADDSSGKR